MYDNTFKLLIKPIEKSGSNLTISRWCYLKNGEWPCIVIVWNKLDAYDVGIRKEPTCKYMNSVSKGKYFER
jgi:hypothetical protein